MASSTVVYKKGSTCQAKNPATCKYHGVPQPTTVLAGETYTVRDAVRRRHELHSTIMANLEKRKDYLDNERFRLVDERNYLDRWVSGIDVNELPVDDNKPLSEVLKGLTFSNNFLNEEDRVGFSNLEGDINDAERFMVMKDANRISEAWFNSCSTLQIYALRKYSLESKDYAVATNESNLPLQWEVLESAVKNSPRLQSPIIVYSGLNDYAGKELLQQFTDGTASKDDIGKIVSFNRVLSSSINPAQVNGFSSVVNPIVVEVETAHGAVLDMMSNHTGEAEVLLPKGEYEVVNVLNNITYFWNKDKKSGREAKLVIQLKLLER